MKALGSIQRCCARTLPGTSHTGVWSPNAAPLATCGCPMAVQPQGRAAFCTTATQLTSSAPLDTDTSAGPSSAATAALRFQAGRSRMSPLQRAAAAAHDALAAPAPAPAAPAAPRIAVSSVGARAGRPGGVAAAASLRSGPAPVEIASVDDEAAAEEEREAEERRRRFVGQLQSVPHVVSAAEHLASARKKAARVTPSAGIKNAAEKERNRAARSLDTLMQALSVPLGRYVSSFPAPARLHPFERALLGLTVGEGAYTGALQRVDKLRRAVQEVGKSAASRASHAPNKAAATAALEEGSAAIEAVFSAGARHVDALKEVAKSLRGLPSLDSALPTLALVGAPNVGKSSLVQLLSSGTPEICNYPFTTRSIKMGHFYLDAQKHQVTDTPGLLRRPDAERNRMEALTLAALGCLDSAVLFVADLTEECGTAVADQWAIRSELRARFPAKPWIDVLSKADMLQDVFEEADALIRARAATPSTPASAPATGTSNGLQHTATATGTTTAAAAAGEAAPAGEASDEVASAAEMAARLPAALRISSLTQDGIPALQLAIIRTLRAQAEARRAAQAAEAAAEATAAQAAARQQAPPGMPPPTAAAGPGGKPPVLTFFST